RLKPGPKPRLSHEMIVQEACRLLASGSDNFTMANLAANLEAGVMTLYRYFPSRDSLLDAVGEHLIGQWNPPETEGRPWQDVVLDWLCETQRLWHAYPNALRVVFWNGPRTDIWAELWAAPLAALFRRHGMTDEHVAFATY